MAAIDEHDELDGTGPPEINQRIERRANRPARVQHVVHQQDVLAVDEEGDLGPAHQRLRPHGRTHQVVAVERDIERAGGHLYAGDVLQVRGDPRRNRHPARANADQSQGLHASVALVNLVGDAQQAARDPLGVHDYGHGTPEKRSNFELRTSN